MDGLPTRYGLLTPREREVMALVFASLLETERIAAELGTRRRSKACFAR
jgi:FixJ family two-component response regulator